MPNAVVGSISMDLVAVSKSESRNSNGEAFHNSRRKS